MNVAVNELANAVFKKQLHECSLDELEQLAQQYPYFGPAHLLLAKKLSIESGEQEDNSSLYEEQVQKTSLYFQNRVWLHYLLNEKGDDIPVSDNHPIVTEKEVPVADEEQNKSAEFTVNENKEAELIQGPANEEIIEQPEPPVEMSATNTEPIAQPLTNENKEEQFNPESGKEEIIEQTETPVEIPSTYIEPFAQPLINENKEEQFNPESGKEEITEQTGAPVEMPTLKFEPVPANTGLVFEPYHTVDYFASQGIRFKEEEKPKDRFSTQLKSFTEWLKTMKRIPVTEEIAANDSAGDKKVDQLAEYSLAERHVITEAMAEVWKKQGNRAKAEDIYRKLSLLEPSKSSYFATKIEELKKTS